ncbi:hypothetical protein A3A21_01635 [Candidatus Jorgensenbacteria bacterium RIFCSPLOWO2_01_FULL_45_25b]|uniref:ComEC/Rec2-related protein domain-containing protein n=1 Tax=Candidatus Jorgensenbacteria bacterium RIFCSPLOWO2_01_FULL_45_25b TaxID=1798471 RepID=A0A1F6BT38_9BACT|nr:MAG: hypothetical protein A3A21_01635 [Candidatus Jorgensenbacteria bacterium RIFCSPLOWO2_01_FULL_45_25b]
MFLHDKFFYASCFFLLGIYVKSIGRGEAVLELTIILIILTLIAVLLFPGLETKRTWLLTFSCLALLAPVGAMFYTWKQNKEMITIQIPFGQKQIWRGKIINNPERGALQTINIKLEEQHEGNIKVNLQNDEEYEYGDVLELEGVVKKIPKPYGSYYEKKEQILGELSFPKIKKFEKGDVSVKKTLFHIRNRAIRVFQKTLPYNESAFMSGITLGAKEEFSKTLKDDMKKSGTTHLVALSGYNITILITALLAGLGTIWRKRTAFFVAILGIIAFVIMTGGESSVMRAAIMGIAVNMAPIMGRVYAPRNIIMLSALVMALQNPNILAFDVGFQLSFLALLGIVYLFPAIQNITNLRGGFLRWKENAAMTLSAQLMVAPILIQTFEKISLTSLISNILIMELIPTTMALGFLQIATHQVSQNLAQILAWLSLLPLKTELGIISLFSNLSVEIHPRLTLPFIIGYYALLARVIHKWKKS